MSRDRVKWYFAVSERSFHDVQSNWPGMIDAAVESARRHTHLQPHLLYDGRPNRFTERLAEAGVTIHPHRVSIRDDLARFASQASRDATWMATATGAFLRIDIPMVEREEEVVLYTDCDVLFRPGFSIADVAKPSLFAAAGQESRSAADDMNSGVLLINVPRMREAYPAFLAFVKANLHLGFDQEVMRPYFHGRFDTLPNALNWKPYWGVDPGARLVHFHGLKPTMVRQIAIDDRFPAPNPNCLRLFRKNPSAYEEYLACWDDHARHYPPQISCHLDEATARRIGGWAYYPDKPGEVVSLSVFLDGQNAGTVSCDGMRTDVRTAGYPTARVGFAFTPPSSDRPRVLHLEDAAGEPVVMRWRGQGIDKIELLQPPR